MISGAYRTFQVSLLFSGDKYPKVDLLDHSGSTISSELLKKNYWSMVYLQR